MEHGLCGFVRLDNYKGESKMIGTVKRILIGACYGACAILFWQGDIVRPLLLSHILAAIVVFLAAVKVIKKSPDIMSAFGFAAGIIITMLAIGEKL
ncbi:MAG: hypothetical protein BWY15_01067 [Firmicutes bacterium ADurb.Bin193]|nr:MAG: hypothetical protein BWY15_01067 [Firmicutes bacterium ADurb.Bin193]